MKKLLVTYRRKFVVNAQQRACECKELGNG